MNNELIVNITSKEVRVAVIEEHSVQEIYVERTKKRNLVGNIYKGKIIRVLPGMQSAFVDIGLKRSAFLHLSDVYLPENDFKKKSVEKNNITELLQEGQIILVQIIKNPIGNKGARLTTQISLASHLLIFVSNLDKVGVSLKIKQEQERERLKALLQEDVNYISSGGYVIRTVAEGAVNFNYDTKYLKNLYADLQENIKTKDKIGIIYEDLPLIKRLFRDLLNKDIVTIRIDNQLVVEQAKEFVKKLFPDFKGEILYYEQSRPIFDLYNIDEEINKSLQRTIQLKSGGYLVFDQNEAMNTIDVNTGAFTGRYNLEETAYKTNLEAVKVIAKQLRLRNLGGIIIIDFIDMHDEEHKKHLLSHLEQYISKDPMPTAISEVSTLGLVQMTRKRIRDSLRNQLCKPCKSCNGRGVLKTAETVCYEIFREILRVSPAYNSKQILILASEDVIERLLDEDSDSLAEIEINIKKIIKLQAETVYSQEQFDIVFL